MYNDPNAQQPPYGQPPYGQQPYTSPYEQQYSQPPPETPPYAPTQPPYQPTQYGAPPVYPQPMYVPAPQPPKSNKTLWIVLSIVGGVLLLLIGLCGAIFYSAGKAVSNFSTTIVATSTAIQQTSVADEEPPQKEAENYYLAISVQDYANAYSIYVAPNVQVNGTTLTQSAFIQQAQARDTSGGDVTDYTATADPNDPTKVTVQVTRQGGSPYTVHLTFTQGDFQWMINSFDNI